METIINPFASTKTKTALDVMQKQAESISTIIGTPKNEHTISTTLDSISVTNSSGDMLTTTKGLDGGMRYDFIPKNQNIISDRVIDITDIAEKISSADETLRGAAELMIYKIKNHGLSPEINTITTEIVNNSETISTVIETLSK